LKSNVRKWGNSLALRISKAHADEIGLTGESEVDVVVREGRLVVSPCLWMLSLTSLVRKITPAKRHGEVDMGPPRGAEEW
jgi:antitoxin MazE